MNPQVSPLPVSGHETEAYNPFADPAGLGARAIGCDAFSGELLEVLRLTPDLGTPAGVEPLVRARCAQFASASAAGRAAGLSPVVRIQRAFDGRLEVWSRLAEGFRLSAVLEWADARGAAPSLSTALTIGDRLLAALGSLQAAEQTDGASGHGAIAIDQIVVAESGALTLTDYAFGTTLAAVQWPRERLWRRFRIAMPPSAGLSRFDHRVDVTQTAVVIAALLAGRAFREHEYPRALPALIAEAVDRSCAGTSAGERNALTEWLRSATEHEPRNAFRSAALARAALRASLAHAVDDTKGVGKWLRAVRGVEEPKPVPAQVQTAPEPAPAASDPAVADRPGGKVRKWLSRW